MCTPCVHTRASSWSQHLHIHNYIQTPSNFPPSQSELLNTLDNLRENPQVARRLRSLLHSETYPSEIAQSHRFCNRVQDAYTLRCAPQVFMVQQVHEIYFGFQVHGIVHDTIDFVRGLITTEMNSATDNPIVLVSLTRSFSILAITLSLIPQPSSLKCL